MHHMILYRGPLSSCNYGCDYCPFSKRRETHAQLAGDRAALAGFLDWCRRQKDRGHQLSIFFTPWGEALVRSWYQKALVDLGGLAHITGVAIQTNLSCRLDWIADCDLQKLGLWCTFHPSETSRDRFLSQCRRLDAMGARYSVGIVGLKEHLSEAQWLRRQLHPHVYLWINAYKREESYYNNDEASTFTAIDPLFPLNNTKHPSLGHACRCGQTVFAVDGDGTMRRCHFIKTPIGNIYDEEWEKSLRPTVCTNNTCGCHIGYVHMPELRLYDVFEGGIAERIPRNMMGTMRSPYIGSGAARPTSRRVSLPQVSTSGL